MTATLLDFSQRRELALHGEIVADVEAAAAALGVTPLIAGAKRAKGRSSGRRVAKS
jgi:hypothetical protein